MASTSSTYIGRFVGGIVATAIFAGLAFALLRWLGFEIGSITDWAIALLILAWLSVVVTLPWDLHFKARAILDDAAKSREQGLTVAERDISYVRRWATIALVLAIVLHLATAGGLYLLSRTSVGVIGLYGAGAALLLMGLRPAGRAYEYLVARLGSIGREVRYPRDDVIALRERVEKIERACERIEHALDVKHDGSWAAGVTAAAAELAAKVEAQRAVLADLRTANDDEHRKLARDAEAAAARIAEDARVLNHVRELVRFFKEA